MSNKKGQEKNKRKKIIFPLILAVVLMVALVFTVKEYIYFQSHEVTDDAQIDADISPVIARVSGYVKEIRFADNRNVKAGDTLAVLDDRDYKNKLRRAEAALASARQAVTVSRYAVQEYESGIATAQPMWKPPVVRVWKATEDFNRYQNLFNDHAITGLSMMRQRRKRIGRSSPAYCPYPGAGDPQKVSTGEQQAMAVASDIAARESDVEFTVLQLSYTAIIAPADGIVSKEIYS